MARCRICSVENPPGAQRCESCGAWLDLTQDAASAKPASKAATRSGGAIDSTEEQVLSWMRQGRKIDAIKVYRAATGVGLKEAKEAVEEIARRYGISPGTSGGCGAVAIVLILVLVLCAGAGVAVYMSAGP